MKTARTAVRGIRLARVRIRNIRSHVLHGIDFGISSDALIAPGASLVAGNRVSIGPSFTAFANLTIGDDVMISAKVGVIGDDHPFDHSPRSITSFEPKALSHIILDGDNLVGYGATILGNIHIGKGAIVGAGALVLDDVPPNAIVAGSPARIIRYRRA